MPTCFNGIDIIAVICCVCDTQTILASATGNVTNNPVAWLWSSNYSVTFRQSRDSPGMASCTSPAALVLLCLFSLVFSLPCLDAHWPEIRPQCGPSLVVNVAMRQSQRSSEPTVLDKARQWRPRMVWELSFDLTPQNSSIRDASVS